jgi:hypothetical protein
MNVAELHTEHIVGHDLATETTAYLQEHGYVVDVTPRYVVASDSGKGYLVSEIDTHTRPFEDADAVADAIEIWSCTCDDYRYGSGLPDLSEQSVTEWEPCKHIISAVREVRAANDDAQATL